MFKKSPKTSKSIFSKKPLVKKKHQNFGLDFESENSKNGNKKLLQNRPTKLSKKLPLIYKILLSLSIFCGLILFYFIILVSSSPRSIDFVTKKIQKNLDVNFQERIKISKTLIKFTSYGSFRISIHDIKISYKDIDNAENKSSEVLKNFNIPKIEAEFSLLDVIRLKFNPNKIKIFKPEILIDNTAELNNYLKNSSKFQNSQAQNLSIQDNQQLLVLIEFLSSLRRNKNPIDNFEIEDAKIVIQTSKINSTLIIKNAKISTKINRETLDIFTQGQIYFVNNKSDFKIDSNCKLSKIDGLKCDINIFNFVPNSIAVFHPVLDELNNINTSLNGTLHLEINNSKLINKIDFKLRADEGNFEFKNFFKDKIQFKQMKIVGNFDGTNKILTLQNVNTILISNIANQTEISNPHLDLGLVISMLNNNQTTYDFEIGLENVLTNEINRFWPITLSQSGIRDWVIEHISNGVINKAYTKFSLVEDSFNNSTLNDLNAQLDFSKLDINYDKNFPEITNIRGMAIFSKNDMKISISSGNVLNSKISKGEVIIDNFQMPINILKITALINGSAGDGLKHASNNLEFRSQVDKYLLGTSKSSVEIMIPIIEKLNLKDVFIDVKSDVFGVKNDFIDGDMYISSKKDFGTNIFNTFIDLKNLALENKELKIFKKKNDDWQLSFGVRVDDKFIGINNILYTNNLVNNSKNNKKIDKEIKKIIGSIEFGIEPFYLVNLDINAQNIGKNNYQLNYNFDKANSLATLNLKGKKFDASNIINSKILKNNQQNSVDNIKIKVALNNLELANNKQLGAFNLNLICSQKICSSGYLNATISKQKDNSKNINLKIVKNQKKDDYSIEGQIQDLGFLAEGLGISKLISGGVAKVNILQNIIDKKLVLSGNLNLSSDITIYETLAVKKLSNNSLFSQIKDKIFSSEKTTFSSLVADFVFQDSELTLKSFIANNFKIGITAKGKINLNDDSINIKGMIVPGYIVNSLFGLGKIPVLGNVISGILTGGEGGGIFSIRYEYIKNPQDKEGKFSTNKVSAFVPSSISNLFD